VKAALSVHCRVLPPTLNVTAPNPGWTPASPFTLSNVARPWPARQRIAGVSAFGFGGTNFHVVLSAYDGEEATTGLSKWPAELFLFRGADRAEALPGSTRSPRHRGRRAPLAQLARACAADQGMVQIALVARDVADLKKKIALAREGKAQASGVFFAPADAHEAKRIAFLFPGQGSQRVGMLADLFIAFPELSHLLVKGERWRETIFPPTPWQPEDEHAQQAAITDTRVAQPALGIAGLAMAQLLSRFGVHPDMVAGHSYGELVALCVAGALPEEALLELSELRGRRILESCAGAEDAGTMAAVAADRDVTAAHLAGIEGVVIANENSPEQSVISGPKRAVDQAVERLLEASIAAKTIPVACAFHSPLVQDACAAFAADLASIDVAAPRLPVYSNTLAGTYPAEPAAVRALLADHIGQPVRFAAEIEAMYAAGARIFVEAGPGRVLTGLVGRILGKRPHVAIACDRAGENGIAQFLLGLGQLAVQGVCVDAQALFAGRDVATLSLDAPPPLHSPSAWWVNGHRAWPMHGEAPANALRPITEPIRLAPARTSEPAGEREAVVLDYLRNVREMVDAQRRVMLSYLGSDPGAAPAVIEGTVTHAPIAAPRPSAPAPAPVIDVPVVVAADKPLDITATLLAIVSERTGYPLEMLDLDLDLEADLSIDSIKRVEILGAVAERLRGSASMDVHELPEDLVAVKTLRRIVEALTPLIAGGSGSASAIDTTAQPAKAPSTSGVDRYVVALEPSVPGNGPWRLADRDIAIVGAAPALDTILLKELVAAGSKARVVTGDASAADAMVDLTPLREDWKADDVPALFGRVRDALVKGASHVLVAGTANGYMLDRVNGLEIGHPSAGGVSGMIKSLRKEWPDRQIRVANFASRLADTELAARLLAELAVVDDAGEVGYSEEGVRQMPRLVRAERSAAPVDGASVSLDGDSVVLITGGARGITARIAIELGRRYRCRLHLVGRSAAPAGPEDADLRDAIDAIALRRALVARGAGLKPPEIESIVSRVLAAREIAATLAALADAGARAAYHQLDVRDAAAFGALVDRIYAEDGRLTGVIHGAGVIEDKLAREKSPESFARVFETKVNGALAIARHVRDDIGFIVFFSSISSTLGSRGQSDYAAANDYLDRLAYLLRHKLSARVMSINWGPWGGVGMVSPELMREYAIRGIGLIDPDAGVASFFDELLHVNASDAQVILMRGDPAAMQ
jgi:malonyl CoA-acyl carrier protein transacylase/NADP-dependent 3-hydroxy acid dehydrogenase YdfG